MRIEEQAVSWVVYKMPINKKLILVNAVCEQSEWDAMELATPGQHTLIKAGILNEGEAEKLARSGQPSEGKGKVTLKER